MLLCIILTTAAFAVDFSVSTETVKNSIFSDEVAEFIFTITNTRQSSQRLTVFSNDPSWSVYVEGSQIILGAGETKTVTVLLDPSSTLDSDRNYGVPITVRSVLTSQLQSFTIPVTIRGDQTRTYSPSIFVDVTIGPENEIDPTESFDVTVRLINRNRLNIETLQLRLVSPLFEDTIEVALPPEERITKILTYQISPQTRPQTTNLEVFLRADERNLGSVQLIPFEVVASQRGFSRTVITDSNRFLKSEYKANITNVGNVASTEVLSFQSSRWQRLFTQSNLPLQYSVEDGNYVATYSVSLPPGERLQIEIIRNYRPFTITLASIILLVLIALVSYYTFRSPVVVKKRIETLSKSTSDDSTSRLKIILDVKNRTSKLLEQVKVIERVPNITEVDKEFSVGTLKPTKVIANHSKGTLVRWDFSTLEPFEERIITYTITSKLSILGEIDLPATLVKFETQGGQTRTVEESKREL